MSSIIKKNNFKNKIKVNVLLTAKNTEPVREKRDSSITTVTKNCLQWTYNLQCDIKLNTVVDILIFLIF